MTPTIRAVLSNLLGEQAAEDIEIISNDVDIIFTHPTPGVDRGLCKKLVKRLRERGASLRILSSAYTK